MKKHNIKLKMKYIKFLSFKELYKMINPSRAELTMKLNFALTDTINTSIETINFQFFSVKFNDFEFVNKYKQKITEEEQIWKSCGLAVEERNIITGEVKINNK